MANLRNSRGKFFATHKMPTNKTFWEYYFDRAGKSHLISAEYTSALKKWNATRSNCPSLENTLESLIDVIPPEWRALANNLFAGRVLDGEANAAAWTEKQAGIIEINAQYSFILTDYVHVFDRFRDYIAKLVEMAYSCDSASEALLLEEAQKMSQELSLHWSEIEEKRKDWADISLVQPGGTSRSRTPNPSRAKVLSDVESVCEEFIIAHELSHHLLGHTVSRREKKKAKEVVDQALTDSGSADLLTGINRSQQDELQADLLAYLIVARATDSLPDFGYLYRSIFGSTIALLSLAHLNGNWAHDSSSTHPGFDKRFQLISRLTFWLSVNRPRDADRGHPLGQLSQLAAFSSIAYQSYDANAKKVELNQGNVNSVCLWLLKQSGSLSDAIPDS
ncbi:M48 family metalloprotease [Saccharopolyspora aridisoli]|nr:hypothetical protein [Saccharopolyspora aridisoli]